MDQRKVIERQANELLVYVTEAMLLVDLHVTI